MILAHYSFLDGSFDGINLRELSFCGSYERSNSDNILHLSISELYKTVDNATASAGDTVTVTVRIVNNPGVAGAVLRLSYDSNLTLTGAASGEAFSYLQYTRPGQYSNPCNFSWDSESGMATDDGTILTLTFRVSDSVSSGDKLNVNVSYTHGDIYDENLDDVDLDIINSHITIN